MNLDDFETWVGDHLSEAIQEMRDGERPKRHWIVAFNNALLDIAKHEAETEDEETETGDDDTVLRVEHDEADE